MKKLAPAFLLALTSLALAQNAPKPATQPAQTQPAKAFTSIVDMLADVPKELLPDKNTPAPVNKARVDPETPGIQKWIDTNRKSVNVSLEMPITVISLDHPDSQGIFPVQFIIPATDILNRQRRVILNAYFPKEDAARFAKLKPGDKLTVEGEALLIKINEYYVQLTIYNPHAK